MAERIARFKAFGAAMAPQTLEPAAEPEIVNHCDWLGTSESGGLFHLPRNLITSISPLWWHRHRWENYVVRHASWRYMLTRIWRPPGLRPAPQQALAFAEQPNLETDHLAVFIGLNPSTATHEKNDPTITRCRNFAMSWGCRGFVMLNIFAWRDVSPKEMKKQHEGAEGRFNRQIVTQIVESTIANNGIVVACWGTHGAFKRQQEWILREWLSPEARAGIQCLSKTSGGYPGHPLYLKASLPLRKFGE